MSEEPENTGTDFEKRREAAREKIDAMDKADMHEEPNRERFFKDVYVQAEGDAAFVPWADLKPKDQLKQWLKDNNGIGMSAIDVACGLGDNAEAMAKAGYDTTAFDVSSDAINWTKKRFPESSVNYVTADLFDLPADWLGAFDLVNECYTLQALPADMLERVSAAIASLVKPGGTLLVYTRWRENGTNAEGPPWPLEESRLQTFASMGFELKSDERFVISRRGQDRPHSFMEWTKNGA